MGKDSGTGNPVHAVPALASFVFLAASAVVLLLGAFVAWLAELLGSCMLAMACVGGALLLSAVVVYFTAVRGAMNYLRDRMETVYDVARLTREAYEWVLDKYRFVRLLLELLRGGK